MVPERKSTFVQFLKEQKDKLQEERDSWATRYHKLYKDYTVLKCSYMFQQCQTTSKENTLQRELIKKRSRNPLLARSLRKAFTK